MDAALSYGEGFIIADQAPGLMDMAVIRNTNTKIIMRLPDQGDRELVGKAAGLNDDQIKELAKLPMGVAAVYQNEWLAPVLCKVDYFYEKKQYGAKIDISTAELNQLELEISILDILADDQIPEHVEAFCKKLIKAEMKASLKCLILQYLGGRRKSEASIYTLSLRTKIAAAFFDAEKHLAKFSGAETPDAKSLEHYLKDRLSEYLQDLDEEIQRRLITLIVEGACANDIKYRPLADCWRDSLSRKGMIG